jgi:endoglucanase
MKSKFILQLALGLSLFSCQTHSDSKIESKPGKFLIHRGVNASHWLSQTEMRGDERANYMLPIDFKTIADMGFDHVRLPVDEMHLWEENGNRLDEGFKLLHYGIQECLKNNLRVIIDLHVQRTHHFNAANGDGQMNFWNNTQAQEKFIGFWRSLSAELDKYPLSMLAYEPMNEAVADTHDDWNKLINKAITEIRKLEPKRTIIMGSNMWQQTATFKYLQVPEKDSNIILSFHIYEPMAFTHYKAPWTPFPKHNYEPAYPGWAIDTIKFPFTNDTIKSQIDYGARYYTKESLKTVLLQAIEVADSLNLPLYCGEFGCFPSTPITMRQQWYFDMVDLFNKHHIAWSHWNYKNDFPLVNEETLEPDTAIVNILMKE